MQSILENLLTESIKIYNETSNIKSISSPECIFDILFSQIREYHETPAHNLTELRMYKTTKSKGDLFEELSKRYLLHILGYEKVWLLKEIPEDVKKSLKMPLSRGDYGIDIVCENKGKYTAVQCKFKNPKSPVKVLNKKGELKTIYPCVGWKELTTFNELCNSTGPWSERIVMTTAKSVRRIGGIKIKGDKSICLGSFRKLKQEDFERFFSEKRRDVSFEKMVVKDDKNKEQKEVEKLTIEELRKKRLEYYRTKN